MTDLLKMSDGELQARVTAINSMVTAMADAFEREEKAVRGTDWHGAAGDAYKDMFTNARTAFKKVEENLMGCASLLQSMKDGFQQMDADMARRVASGG